MYPNLPTPGPRRSAPLGAYRAVAAQSALDGATPHQLVALLYEALAGEIAAARGAVARRDMAEKNRAISHAVRLVAEGLAAPLDYRNGGDIAARLGELYDYIVRRLTHANLHHDDEALAECGRLVGTLQEGWNGIAAQVVGA
jgi:flagellar protein FliS